MCYTAVASIGMAYIVMAMLQLLLSLYGYGLNSYVLTVMASTVMAYISMVSIGMAYIGMVMLQLCLSPYTYCINSCGLYSHGLYRYGLYSHGLYSYGLYTYGLHSYGHKPVSLSLSAEPRGLY